MISQVYGFTPTEISELTLGQFSSYRDYAFRARQEDLLGYYCFHDGKWQLPGMSSKAPVDSEKSRLEAAIREYRAVTGKKLITPEDFAIIKEQYMKKD